MREFEKMMIRKDHLISFIMSKSRSFYTLVQNIIYSDLRDAKNFAENLLLLKENLETIKDELDEHKKYLNDFVHDEIEKKREEFGKFLDALHKPAFEMINKWRLSLGNKVADANKFLDDLKDIVTMLDDLDETSEGSYIINDHYYYQIN